MDSKQAANAALLREVQAYWNHHIHDLAIAAHPVGTAEFFEELAAYRFDKLHYLEKVVDFAGYAGKQVLEVGCGVGLDLTRFARGGARVAGIDISQTAIDLARRNFAQQGLDADLRVMNGEALAFPDATFDMVYAHGVLQYTADPEQMTREILRVLRPSGQVILMVYNRYSWLNALSKLLKVGLEHEDAPVLGKFTMGELRSLLRDFRAVTIHPDRFPVPTQLHHGIKGLLYNRLFVTTFNLLPKAWVRPLGWHLMAFATKPDAP